MFKIGRFQGFCINLIDKLSTILKKQKNIYFMKFDMFSIKCVRITAKKVIVKNKFSLNVYTNKQKIKK